MIALIAGAGKAALTGEQVQGSEEVHSGASQDVGLGVGEYVGLGVGE